MKRWKKEIKRFRYKPLDRYDSALEQDLDTLDLDLREECENAEDIQWVCFGWVASIIPLNAWRSGYFFPVELKESDNNCLKFMAGQWYLSNELDSWPVDYPQPSTKEWQALTTLSWDLLSKKGKAVIKYWDHKKRMKKFYWENALAVNRIMKNRRKKT